MINCYIVKIINKASIRWFNCVFNKIYDYNWKLAFWFIK